MRPAFTDLCWLDVACRQACHLAPRGVLERVGDLSKFVTWPVALFYLALWQIHPFLRPAVIPLTHDQLREEEQNLERIPTGGNRTTYNPLLPCSWEYWVLTLLNVDLLTATRYAFERLRSFAEVDENRIEGQGLFLKTCRENGSGADGIEPAAGGDVTLSDEQDPAGDPSGAVRLLNVYTNGLADKRLEEACNVLDSGLTANEKLWKLDELMPIPPTVSGEKLGSALGVSKAAIQRTDWYIEKRKGRKDEEIDQREERLRQRGQTHERDRHADDDE